MKLPPRTGKNVTIILAFKDGVGADVAFSMNGPPYGDLVTPYPFSTRLNATNPTSTWSGVVQPMGSYRIELANISDADHPVRLHVFVQTVYIDLHSSIFSRSPLPPGRTATTTRAPLTQQATSASESTWAGTTRQR